MSVLERIARRLRAFSDPNADGELNEEIRFHIELETDKNMAAGMAAAEARRLAVAHFGGVQRVREEHRDVRRVRWTEDVAADTRFAFRSLRRTPGLTGAAVVTLALGIGANVAIFSAVNAVVLQPLPFPSSERLMAITEENPEKNWHLQYAAPANMFDWRSGVADFEDVAMYTDKTNEMILSGNGEPVPVRLAYVSASFFKTLGVRPAMGRDLTEDDNWQSATAIVVLSDRTWRGRFAADRSIVGRTITLDGAPARVVAVMPPSFTFPGESVDLWRAFGFSESVRNSETFRRAHIGRVVARLRPGVSREHGDTQLQAVVARLKREHKATNQYMGAAIMPLHDFLVGDTRLPLLVLLTSVAFLLLIACANVGNLLLVQAAGREREAALRLALGAGRFRLVRQALTESLVLSLVGALCGLVLGWAGTRALVSLQPSGMLRVSEFTVDGRVLGYVLVISAISGLIFGAAPAIWMRHRDPSDSLKAGGRAAAAGMRTKGWGSGLVVGEIALALVMAVGAGLLARSLWQVRRVDPGFDAHGIVAVEIGLGQGYDTLAKVEAFMTQLVERAGAIPGVAAVGLTSSLPFTGTSYTSDFVAAGRPTTGYGTEIGHRTVSPDYFAMMKVPLLRGRTFSSRDVPGGPPVVIINDVVARSYFGAENPIGQRIAFDKFPNAKSVWYTIVGVVGAEHVDALDVSPRSESFVSSVQFPPSGTYLMLRGAVPADAMVAGVRSILHDLNPLLALYSVQTMDELREKSMAKARFLTILLLVFAMIGVSLSVVGVYGVLAHVSRNRTREMGIRLALGARASQVAWLVIRQGVTLAAMGLFIGVAVSLFATRAMTKLLFGVTPNDPLTLAAVVAALAATSAIASWLPAVRASRADPSIALRSD